MMLHEATVFAQEKEAEFLALMEKAEKESGSDYDYYQGCYEAYGVMVAFLGGRK